MLGEWMARVTQPGEAGMRRRRRACSAQLLASETGPGRGGTGTRGQGRLPSDGRSGPKAVQLAGSWREAGGHLSAPFSMNSRMMYRWVLVLKEPMYLQVPRGAAS